MPAPEDPTEARVEHLDVYADKKEEGLRRVHTAGSVVMTPELFEQLYLAPQNKVKGELRQTFGNPTPIALAGFLLCATALSMVLLGWRGAGAFGAANVASYIYLGGVIEILGGVGEWILGNTFPAIVFLAFGGFWITFGCTLVPSYGAYAAYSKDLSNPAEGLSEPAFFATFGFFLVAMTLLVTVFCIASLRTNVVFFTIFLTLIPCFACLSASFFDLANGLAARAETFQHVGAGLLLAIAFMGWYIFVALVLLSVDFPIRLPLGDLSTVIRGASDHARAREVNSSA
ncbi:hypothetical protein CLAIMM_12009 [Cladophialophora immunda]|nr:hypothetical protein CLAIMM_12009 [Cladophialophora immunda]